MDNFALLYTRRMSSARQGPAGIFGLGKINSPECFNEFPPAICRRWLRKLHHARHVKMRRAPAKNIDIFTTQGKFGRRGVAAGCRFRYRFAVVIGGIEMLRRGMPRGVRAASVGLAVLLGGVLTAPTSAMADEGGVSFWLPGLFGSLAAVPQQQPGWSVTAMEFYDSVKAGGDVALARDITIHGFSTNISAHINADLNSRIDLGLLIPSYAFATPVLGGQAAVSMMTIVGRVDTTLQGTIAGTLGPFGFSKFGSRTDDVTGTGDLYPMFSLRWNEGVNNYMTYVTGDLPVGLYDRTSLSNIGIGHYALDAGAGYTYFNPQTGHELSAVAGLTNNFVNPYTNYKNGTDFHLDWGMSQFLSKQFLIGAVGYVYNQLTGDSGSGDHVGPFESRVVGIGPQIGYIFPVGNYQGYINLKGYGEFDAHDRPSGYNAWLTLSISPPAPTPPASASPRMMYTK